LLEHDLVRSAFARRSIKLIDEPCGALRGPKTGAHFSGSCPKLGAGDSKGTSRRCRAEASTMSYRAPVSDIAFTLKHAAGFKQALDEGLYGDLSEDVVDAVLEEAGRFASEVIAPLNVVGDRQGVVFKDGAITTAPGWKEAYRDWTAAGWNGLAAPEQWGGQHLPQAVNFACMEMWNSAAVAFGLAPLLTIGTIDALTAHGSDALQRTYLPKLVAGVWTGTMQLTEPQAGSDLGALRTRAERAADGSYRLTGQKIFITYGEHDMAANIVHLVLARLPDAPAGTRGISLFLVPKFLPKADGSPGQRNDIRAHSIEHKMGIHGSPTCTMVLGDAGGAVGFLVGEENRGLACMFTMMNQARLAVALQGVGVAERAMQQALAYARERKQGRAPGAKEGMSPIIAHPDVKRMLLTMRALTAAARAISYATAVAIDRTHRSPDEKARAAANERASLLTPVAKAFSTDVGCEVSSLGVQVHGGMGFIEETGAAQHYRDARILAIYEGTNGIQAIDLVTRKLPLSGGAAVRGYIKELRATADAVKAANDPAFGATGATLADAIDSLERATEWLLREPQSEAALAGATPYLRLFANAAGGALLAEQALAALRMAGDGEAPARVALARFFAENIAVTSGGLERTVTEGADSVNASEAALG
jgi:alkylation response protein AidB-like acyl-CoA dehydrogenase